MAPQTMRGCCADRTRNFWWSIAQPTLGSGAVLAEWEPWACAQHYIKRHLDDAPIHAAMRADELLAEGDLAGAKNFQAIVLRIDKLLETPEALN
jgi:hypothetical protein